MPADVVMETMSGKSEDKLSSPSHERASSPDKQKWIYDENLGWRVRGKRCRDIEFIGYQSGGPATTNRSGNIEAARQDSDMARMLREHDNVIHKWNDRRLVLVDPWSIHGPDTAIEYAKQLEDMHENFSDDLTIIMRSYLEKPRTTIGWKGLINDPDIDEPFEIKKGLRASRKHYRDLTKDMPIAPPGAARGSISRRGRGPRKNNKYWKSVSENEDLQNPFKRDCLFGKDDFGLLVPASSYMDSTCAVPRCMSRKYLEELGMESNLSTDFDDPGLISIGMGRQEVKMTGLVRDISFRIKGSSTTFKGDFYVSELLDGFYDVLFGWQFMCGEAADILEKAHKVYREAKAFVRRAASAFSKKIEKVQKRVGDFVSGVSSPPPPPYSLVNVLDGDFKVTPRLF